MDPHLIGASRALAGATIVQAAPALANEPVGRSVLDLCIALLRSGARTMVLARGGPLVGELQAVGGEWQDFDVAGASMLGRRRLIQRLSELVLAERVDLVHAHGAQSARDMAAAISTQRRVALVTTHLTLPTPSGWLNSSDGQNARAVAIAPSEYAANVLVKRQRLARDRITVIPRPIDTTAFSSETVGSGRVWALRKAWRIAPEDRIVFAPGRLTRSAGFLPLVEAVRMLVTGGLRRTVFVVAADPGGDEELASGLASRIRAYGLTRAFRRVGHCSDMAAAYAAADFVVISAERTNSFATSAAEAMAVGRPLIVSDVDALSEMILASPFGTPADRTGWLINPGDATALACALAHALAIDRSAWRQISERARADAETRFSRERVIAATLAVYDGLLDAEPGDRRA
jgi:glycosyltransferase involved in cell wall biosynthesis